MLHIILFILKIIGIILVVLLGLTALALLAVLFVPIRYSCSAKYYDKMPEASFKVTWLLHFLTIKGSYEKESVREVKDDGIHGNESEASRFKVKIKLLNFSLYSSGAEKTDKKIRKKSGRNVFDEDKNDEISVNTDLEAPKSPDKVLESHIVKNAAVKDLQKADNQIKQEADNQIKQKADNQIKKVKKNKKRFWTKVREQFQKIIGFLKSFILKVKTFFINVKNKKEQLSDKLKKFSDKLTNPENRELVRFLWEQTKIFLNIIKPKKCRGYIHFGTDDPQTTGKAAMYAAVAYGFLGLDIKIHPDFENKIFEGDLFVKGHFRLFGIVVTALRVYTNELFKKIVLKK